MAFDPIFIFFSSIQNTQDNFSKAQNLLTYNPHPHPPQLTTIPYPVTLRMGGERFLFWGVGERACVRRRPPHPQGNGGGREVQPDHSRKPASSFF